MTDAELREVHEYLLVILQTLEKVRRYDIELKSGIKIKAYLVGNMVRIDIQVKE